MSTSSPLTDQERVEVEVRHLKLVSGTHYETLDLSEGVDRGEVQAAHAALRRRFGEMLRRSDPGDRYYTLLFELLRAIDDATAVLTDTQQRLLYDSSLRRGRHGSARPPSGEHTRRDDAQGVFHQPFSRRPTGETPRVASSPPEPPQPSRRPTQPAARPVWEPPTPGASPAPVVPPPLHRRTPIPAPIEPRSRTPLPFLSNAPTPSRPPSMPPSDHLGATHRSSRPAGEFPAVEAKPPTVTEELDALHDALQRCLAATAEANPAQRAALVATAEALERVRRRCRGA